jgi:Domain of unknown function (DUF4082)/PEP-CTERM motif
MIKVGTRLLVGMMLVFFLSATGRADSTAITLTSYSNFTNGPWTLGFEFSPTANVNVTALGSYFPTGATDVHGVTIWDTSGNPLATTTVTGTGTEGFDFTTISSLLLLAGTNYIIGATTLADNYAFTGPPTFTVDPGINYLGHYEISCAGVTPCFPLPDTSFNDFGANFQFAPAVPEPSSIILVMGGILVFGLFWRLKKRIEPAVR